jgi:hypothetical protein
MTDEATQQEAKWSLYREVAGAKPQKIGGLVTSLEYSAVDDTFWFRNHYQDVKFELGTIGPAIMLKLPKANSDIRVNRAGWLRQHYMDGQMAIELVPKGMEKGFEVATAEPVLDAHVTKENLLVGKLRVTSTFVNIDRDLTPVTVENGQVLNPMMPVARLRDVRPGRRWVIQEVDPLRDAVGLMVKELTDKSSIPALAVGPAGGEPKTLIAEVRSDPVTLTPLSLDQRQAKPVECWVIDYRGDGDVRAATWVGVADGRVYRQEASGFGEKLRFERDY